LRVSNYHHAAKHFLRNSPATDAETQIGVEHGAAWCD